MVTWGHVTSKTRYIWDSARPSCLLDLVIAFKKGWPPTMVTWHNSRMTNKKSCISVFTWFMTTKLDKVMTYETGPPMHIIAWFFDQVLICSLMNQSPIPQVVWKLDTKLHRVVDHDMGPTFKSLIVKSFFI